MDAHQLRCREATFESAAGVVKNQRTFFLTSPSAPQRNGHILLLAQPPSARGGVCRSMFPIRPGFYIRA